MGEQHSVIVAVITTKEAAIKSGGAPVFIVADEEALQLKSLTLEKIMDASAHEIDADTIIIVAR